MDSYIAFIWSMRDGQVIGKHQWTQAFEDETSAKETAINILETTLAREWDTSNCDEDDYWYEYEYFQDNPDECVGNIITMVEYLAQSGQELRAEVWFYLDGYLDRIETLGRDVDEYFWSTGMGRTLLV